MISNFSTSMICVARMLRLSDLYGILSTVSEQTRWTLFRPPDTPPFACTYVQLCTVLLGEKSAIRYTQTVDRKRAEQGSYNRYLFYHRIIRWSIKNLSSQMSIWETHRIESPETTGLSALSKAINCSSPQRCRFECTKRSVRHRRGGTTE